MHDVNHWIATACIGGKVLVADSLLRPLSDYVARQLKQLYAQHLMQNGNLSVTVVPFQQQTNASDCGVFAAGFTFEL